MPHLRLKLLFLGLSLSFSTAVQSQIYRWIDEYGKVHFSDKATRAAKSKPVELREINTYKGVTYETSKINVGKRVVMFSTDWCGVCKRAKAYFRKNNIRFTEYDIEKNARAKKTYDKMGATGVPVILISKKRLNGFSVASFESTYNQ